GLSTSQHHIIYDFEKAASLNTEQELNAGDRSLLWSEDETKILVLGDPSNVVNATHPIHNVTIPKAKKMIEYFREKPFKNVKATEDTEQFDIVKCYQKFLKEDPDVPMPIAAIESLVEVIKHSK
ncbi:17176_t:CDS:2, partial [Gigaspora rosea]